MLRPRLIAGLLTAPLVAAVPLILIAAAGDSFLLFPKAAYAIVAGAYAQMALIGLPAWWIAARRREPTLMEGALTGALAASVPWLVLVIGHWVWGWGAQTLLSADRWRALGMLTVVTGGVGILAGVAAWAAAYWRPLSART